jgi:hypothetical protein
MLVSIMVIRLTPSATGKMSFLLVDREFALNGIHKSMIDSSKADRELTTI